MVPSIGLQLIKWQKGFHLLLKTNEQQQQKGALAHTCTDTLRNLKSAGHNSQVNIIYM